MKTLILAAATAATFGLAAPQQAEAGGFAISFGNPRGFGYPAPVYHRPVFHQPVYGYGAFGGPVGFSPYGHRGFNRRDFNRRDFDRRDFNRRGFNSRDFDRRRGRSGFDSGDVRRLQRNVRRVIRRF